jgi:hypothetical protein
MGNNCFQKWIDYSGPRNAARCSHALLFCWELSLISRKVFWDFTPCYNTTSQSWRRRVCQGNESGVGIGKNDKNRGRRVNETWKANCLFVRIRKERCQQFNACSGLISPITSAFPSKSLSRIFFQRMRPHRTVINIKKSLGRTNRLLSLILASNNSSVVACVFVTAATFLPSRCLATMGWFLPSRYLATIGTDTHRQHRDL